MPYYRIVFHGCLRGATGIHYRITAHEEAETPDQALLKLYERYDHIHFPQITEIQLSEMKEDEA